MNMLRRAQTQFTSGRDDAVLKLRQARIISSDETGVRIEGSNAYHWVFRCDRAVVHTASSTRGAIVVHTMMDGHRPDVWCSDRYSAQQGHADAQQACLAHLARDVAYAIDNGDDVLPMRFKLWLQKAFGRAKDIRQLAPTTTQRAAVLWIEPSATYLPPRHRASSPRRSRRSLPAPATSSSHSPTGPAWSSRRTTRANAACGPRSSREKSQMDTAPCGPHRGKPTSEPSSTQPV
jgi:hypothetical protein